MDPIGLACQVPSFGSLSHGQGMGSCSTNVTATGVNMDGGETRLLEEAGLLENMSLGVYH